MTAHLAVRDPKIRPACGTHAYDPEKLTGDKELVDCLRCQGTGWFKRAVPLRPVAHGPAIFFLEKAVLRLNASIESAGLATRREELEDAKTSVLASIELLKVLQFVDSKATEIRARKTEGDSNG